MEAPLRIAAIILAAGESQRFGGPKQIAVLDGRPMVEHVLDLAATAGLDPIVAVVPPWLPQRIDPALDVLWIENPNPDRGLSHSLRLGMRAVPDDARAAVILLGDQPRVPVRDLQALLAARGQQPIAALLAGGRLGSPVLIERSQFTIVEELSEDIGLREVLAAHPELVHPVQVEAHSPDVDTPDDLARLSRP